MKLKDLAIQAYEKERIDRQKMIIDKFKTMIYDPGYELKFDETNCIIYDDLLFAWNDDNDGFIVYIDSRGAYWFYGKYINLNNICGIEVVQSLLDLGVILSHSKYKTIVSGIANHLEYKAKQQDIEKESVDKITFLKKFFGERND